MKQCFQCVLTVLLMQQLSAHPIWTKSSSEVRNLINQKIMATPADKPEVYQVVDRKIECGDRETPLRIYFPHAGKNIPLLLLIHGGAWVAGNLDTHDHMARYLCREAQVVVVCVGYTNSPQAKFPLPLEQCYDALLWSVTPCELPIDPLRISVGGDSAGGNMAAALCLLARDRQGPDIRLQVLINPSTDLTCGGTIKEQGDTQDIMRWFATQYVLNPEDVYHPYVSPILATNLNNLPPALIILAEKDELREDGQRYADRLCAAGILTTTYIQYGIGHLGGEGARASTTAQESLNVAAEALRDALQ